MTLSIISHMPSGALLLISPPTTISHIGGSYAASVIMTLTYGKTTPTSYTDPEVIEVNKCIKRLGTSLRQGTYLVDTFPLLKYVPGYLTDLRRWHKEELQLFSEQLQVVRLKRVSFVMRRMMFLLDHVAALFFRLQVKMSRSALPSTSWRNKGSTISRMMRLRTSLGRCSGQELTRYVFLFPC